MSTTTPQQAPRRGGATSHRAVWPYVCAVAGVLSVPAMWLPLPHLLLVVVAGIAGVVAVMTTRDSQGPSMTTRVLCGLGLASAALSLAISLASCATDAF